MSRGVGRQGDYLKKISLFIRDELIINVCEGTPPCPEPIMVLASTSSNYWAADTIFYPAESFAGQSIGASEQAYMTFTSSGYHAALVDQTYMTFTSSGYHTVSEYPDSGDSFTGTGSHSGLGSTII